MSQTRSPSTQRVYGLARVCRAWDVARSTVYATNGRAAAPGGLTAPRAPWQNPFVERVIGSIRRECLDHCLILNVAHLRRFLRGYIGYYNTARPHQSLDNNSPQPRAIEPPPCGRIIAIPQVGGLHHRYQRAA